jgi:hypothetical protein
MNSPVLELPLPELYYQSSSRDYWMPDKEGKWIPVTETSAKRYLRSEGYSDVSKGAQSEVEDALLRIQKSQNVEYASRLAGYEAGCHLINERKVLVTESSKLVLPQAGEWPLLGQVLEGMLNVDPVDQRPYFFGWMRRSLESFHSREWTQAQVLAFAGPRNSGKSLIQSIITEVFGGRSSKPFLYMTGKTTFNSDTFQNEHLVVEDDCESIDIRARRHFGGHIKQVAVNQKHTCHGKNKEALTLTPLWRMSISLNDDPERLLVLPPMTDDIEDKIMLFKIGSRPMPMPTTTAKEKTIFWEALRAELPAFVDAMLKYEIPPELVCPRFGVKHYHHPEILQGLNETSPENRLLTLIDKEMFETGVLRKAVDMTAIEIEQCLTKESSSVSREARLLTTYSSAIGAYLARLAKSHPDRFTKRVVTGQSRWTIQPPHTEVTGVDSTSQSGGVVDHVSDFNLIKKNNKDSEAGDGLGNGTILCSPAGEVENKPHHPTRITQAGEAERETETRAVSVQAVVSVSGREGENTCSLTGSVGQTVTEGENTFKYLADQFEFKLEGVGESASN